MKNLPMSPIKAKTSLFKTNDLKSTNLKANRLNKSPNKKFSAFDQKMKQPYG